MWNWALSCLCALAVFSSLATANDGGFDSPEQAFAAAQRAMESGDWSSFWKAHHPDERMAKLKDVVTAVCQKACSADCPESVALSLLQKYRINVSTAKKVATAVVQKDARQGGIEAQQEIIDGLGGQRDAFLGDSWEFYLREANLPQMSKEEASRIQLGQVTRNGNNGSGKLSLDHPSGKRTSVRITFVRVDDKWFIRRMFDPEVEGGFDTPELAFSSLQKAMAAQNWKDYWATFAPEAKRSALMSFFLPAVCFKAFIRPGDASAKKVLEDHDIDLEAARDVATGFAIVGDRQQKAGAAATRQIIIALESSRLDSLLAACWGYLVQTRGIEVTGPEFFTDATLKGLEIDKDSAKATIQSMSHPMKSKPIQFKQIDGRWYVSFLDGVAKTR